MKSDLYRLLSLIDHCHHKCTILDMNTVSDSRLTPPDGYIYEAEQTARLLLEQLETTVTWQENQLHPNHV